MNPAIKKEMKSVQRKPACAARTAEQGNAHVAQAIVSLIEELEAADWYRQRADDCEDAALKEILLHNMREEMEHASMILEWLRRNNKNFGRELKEYLFSEGDIAKREEEATSGKPGH